MSLAGEIAGIEERIKSLAAFYRCVNPLCTAPFLWLALNPRAGKNSAPR